MFLVSIYDAACLDAKNKARKMRSITTQPVIIMQRAIVVPNGKQWIQYNDHSFCNAVM
jgi:hypothetical protein